jgi:hypothetical protein
MLPPASKSSGIPTQSIAGVFVCVYCNIIINKIKPWEEETKKPKEEK